MGNTTGTPGPVFKAIPLAGYAAAQLLVLVQFVLVLFVQREADLALAVGDGQGLLRDVLAPFLIIFVFVAPFAVLVGMADGFGRLARNRIWVVATSLLVVALGFHASVVGNGIIVSEEGAGCVLDGCRPVPFGIYVVGLAAMEAGLALEWGIALLVVKDHRRR